MIYAQIGHLGAGKGIQSCEFMEQAWRQGRTIVTNMDLLPGCPFYKDAFRIGCDEWPVASDKLSLWNYSHLFPDSLIVIDEADIYFDCVDHAKFERDAKIWIKMSRKERFDVIFVVQSLENLNVRMRRMCQMVWWCEWTWRSRPFFQDLAKVVGEDVAKSFTRFNRHLFDHVNCKNHVETLSIRHAEVADKYFVDPWFRTDQVIGRSKSENAKRIAAFRESIARGKQVEHGQRGGHSLAGQYPVPLEALGAGRDIRELVPRNVEVPVLG